MAKESLSAPQKAPIFRETFADEQTTRVLGGVPTSVTYSEGTCAFSGSSSSIRYNKNFNGVYSLRIKFSSITYQASKYIIDFRNLSGAGTGYIFFSGGIFGVSSGTTYINGVATTAFSSGANDVVITGMTISSSLFSLMYNYLNAFYTAGTIELFEIYDYTLTAQEVANLYNNKRYNNVYLTSDSDGIGFKKTAATSGNLVETGGLTWPTAGGGTFIVKYSTTNNNQTGSMFFHDSGSYRVFGVQVTTAKAFNFFFGSGFARVATSTVGVADNFNGYVKVWARTSGADMLVDFYQSTDGVTYTQLGTTITNAGGANSMTTTGSPTAQISVNGTAPGGNPFVGNIYSAYAYDANGTLFLAFDNLKLGGNGTSFVSSSGTTWTVYSTGVGTITAGATEILNVDGKNGVIANKWNTTLTNTAVTPKRAGDIWAMEFNGSTSKLDCGSYNTLVGDKSFVAWIKAERISSASLEYIFNNGSLLLAIDNGTWYVSNGIVVSSDGSLGVPTAYSASNVIKRMTPFQVVVTRTSTGVANIYVNGVLTGSANQASGTPAAGSTNLTLGASSTSSNLLDGHMSAVRIIDGILTAQEVSQLFSNERRNYGI